jgi:hypothetical protein
MTAVRPAPARRRRRRGSRATRRRAARHLDDAAAIDRGRVEHGDHVTVGGVRVELRRQRRADVGPRLLVRRQRRLQRSSCSPYATRRWACR